VIAAARQCFERRTECGRSGAASIDKAQTHPDNSGRSRLPKDRMSTTLCNCPLKCDLARPVPSIADARCAG